MVDMVGKGWRFVLLLLLLGCGAFLMILRRIVLQRPRVYNVLVPFSGVAKS